MPGGRSARSGVGTVLLLGALLAAIAAALWHDSRRSSAVQPNNRPIQAKEGNFLTSNSCRACHPGNYASWHASFHRTMTQVSSPENLLGFDRALDLSFDGHEYKMEREGN